MSSSLLRWEDDAEDRLIGIWQVPTEKLRLKAVKFLKKMNVTNINLRVEKP